MSAQPIRPTDDTNEPILSLIQRIKAGQVSSTSISAEQRKRCVEVLRAEGYGIAEIAQILHRCEKTIRRDIEQIREERALRGDPNLVPRLVGDMVGHAEVSIARLRRIARETSATALERATAEGMAWKVARDLTQLLQSLGYLPRSPVGIVASVHSQVSTDSGDPGDELIGELELLERLVASSSIANSPEATRCEVLLEVARQRRSAREVKNIHANIETKESDTHEPPTNPPAEAFDINDAPSEP